MRVGFAKATARIPGIGWPLRNLWASPEVNEVHQRLGNVARGGERGIR
jgi:hypothetical protein